ncbi:MAG: MarR family transcriptional regulator [Candidatus Dormiibacterota bacterium]
MTASQPPIIADPEFGAMLPLSALLSQTLVAYTVEFDNEFEHQIPHRTTTGGRSGAGGPWLTSMVMWFNCMRHLSEAPIPARELLRRARTPTNLAGMQRWGYIDVSADPDDTRAHRPPAELLVRATAYGLVAQRVWRPLADVVERRWEERWGSARIEAARTALRALVSGFDIELPDCLPILGYGLWSARPSRPAFASMRSEPADEVHSLPTLLSRALLMAAVDFEARSKVSLAIYADVLRVLEPGAVPLRDIPRRSGVSKEAISMAAGVLTKRGLVAIEADPTGGRGRVVSLTAKGSRSKSAHEQLLRSVEQDWVSRFGGDVIGRLRDPLEQLAGDSRGSLLFPALRPYPEGWRASVPLPETLPHFPMVLHRGGYPDGS